MGMNGRQHRPTGQATPPFSRPAAAAAAGGGEKGGGGRIGKGEGVAHGDGSAIPTMGLGDDTQFGAL